MVAVVEDDLVVAQVAADADQRRPCRARDARDLRARLGRLRRAVDADHAALAVLGAKPAIMPACVEPVTEHTIDRVEEDAELALLLLDLRRPAREAEAAERVVRGAGRDRVRLAAAPPRRRRSACSQLSLKPIPKPAFTSRTSAPMMRLSMDVADAVVDDVRPVDPALLHEHAAAARVRAATAATWRVWLDCTPPIETSVSQPCASASATRYSSLRVLLPPKARPLLQSSRLAHTRAPPRCAVSRSSRWIGDGPKSSGYAGERRRATSLPPRGGGAGQRRI